jgi:hypothetical protein
MRKYIVNSVITENKNFQSNLESLKTVITLVPIIGNNYDIEGTLFRCVEHKRGMAVLKNDSILIKLLEIN